MIICYNWFLRQLLRAFLEGLSKVCLFGVASFVLYHGSHFGKTGRWKWSRIFLAIRQYLLGFRKQQHCQPGFVMFWHEPKVYIHCMTLIACIQKSNKKGQDFACLCVWFSKMCNITFHEIIKLKLSHSSYLCRQTEAGRMPQPHRQWPPPRKDPEVFIRIPPTEYFNLHTISTKTWTGRAIHSIKSKMDSLSQSLELWNPN